MGGKVRDGGRAPTPNVKTLVVRGQLNAGLSFGVIHTAFQVDPIGFQNCGFWQEVGPCVTSHFGGLADDVELAVRLNFTDQNRFGQVVVRQHDSGSACEVRELLARKRVDDGVNIGGARFGDSVYPHVKADIVRFHRVVRHARIVTDKAVPCINESSVFSGIRGHEVVPSRQVTDEEVQQLLTDGKVGSLEGQGLDRAALAVPRSANPMGIALSQDPTASTASHRSAIYEAIAQRVVDALGARIQGQIAKGQWTMQLTLRPASLGSIDVDLRMHNGELEARFVSANPLTRDLLQDNAQRLKDHLSQAGTDIARVTVDGDSSQQGHGKSTPQRGDGPVQPRGQAVNSGDVSAQAGTVRENSRDDGTLNILV